MTSDLRKPLGVYFHIPFCRVHCPYCDFYTYPTGRGREEDFCLGLAREIQLLGERLTLSEFHAATVYFGGGTPSTLSSDQLGRLLFELARQLPVDPNAEITLEANPEDVRPEALVGWRAAGVNRVSIGIQTLADHRLQFLGRIHTAATAHRALALLSALPNWSADLMFGWDDQSRAELSSDLEAILSYGPPHVSLYQLTLEPKTRFGVLASQNALSCADSDRQADLYLAACDRLEASGLRQYEVSNFAKPGFESRHNAAYWERRPYAGLGPSAASLLAGRRTKNAASLPGYLAALQAGFLPVTFVEVLQPETVNLERLWLALRTATGVSRDALPQESGLLIEHALADQLLTTAAHDRIVFTRKGMAVADELTRRLLPTVFAKISPRSI